MDIEGLSVRPCEPNVVGSCPAITKRLKDGEKLHAFRSGGGLRVVRFPEDGYGEHPYLNNAIMLCEEDCKAGGQDYNEVYGKSEPHYVTGTTESNNWLDRFVLRGYSFDIYFKKDKFIFDAKYMKRREFPKKNRSCSFRWESDWGITYDIHLQENGHIIGVAPGGNPKNLDPFYFDQKISCKSDTFENLLVEIEKVLEKEFENDI